MTSPGEAAYFTRVDERRHVPTHHAGGAWRDDELHMAPVAGLVTHALERHAARHVPHLQVGRITFEVLGVLWADELTVHVETLRPGRTITLLEAVLEVRGRPAVRARAWLAQRADTSAVAGGPDRPMPGPDAWPAWDGPTVWRGGYIRSLEVRRDPASVAGRARAWLRTPHPLLAGEAVGDLTRWVLLLDTANGIAVRRPPTEWLFPNLDLTVHLHRRPAGAWVGLDTEVTFGPDGLGLTSSVAHDVDGPVGRAEQALTVRPVVPVP